MGLPLLSQDVCKTTETGAIYKETVGTDLPDVQMCAGHLEGRKDACQGDSGGPLVGISSSGSVELVGIVSWGLDCAKPNAPGAYTNVFKFADFIKRTMAPGNCQGNNLTKIEAIAVGSATQATSTPSAKVVVPEIIENKP